jgi:HEPN domain-containing protein
LKDYLKNLKNTLDSQEDALCKEIQRWLPGHQIRKIDHGVISAMFTCHLNKTSPDSVNKAWLEDIQPALRAIIRHNLPEDRIDPKNEPLSFLLFLCDHLQEWDRPRVDRRFRYYLSAHLLRGPGSLPCTTTLIRYLKTNLCWNRTDKKWDLPDDDLKFELVFKDAHKESFEPAIVWCCHSFDLQKIRRDQLSRNISLAFVHPLSEELSRVRDKGDLTEMDLFQDFVMEKGLEAAFSVWLHSIRKKRCDHLSHEYDTKEERFAVTLIKGQKSKETSVIPFLPSGLYEKFLSWKKERIQTIELRGTASETSDITKVILMDNKEKVKYWLDIANYDLQTARAMFSSKRYLYVVFMCQQATEKIIKALYVNNLKEEPPRSHNLAFLFKKIKIRPPDGALNFFNILSAHYIQNRYPDYKNILSSSLTREKAIEYLERTEEIYKWLKSRLT